MGHCYPAKSFTAADINIHLHFPSYPISVYSIQFAVGAPKHSAAILIIEWTSKVR